MKKLLLVALCFLGIHAIQKVPGHVTLLLYQMIKDAHEIFALHNIQYWMHAGTLLGAVRHQGVVPWDDDADLVILDINEAALIIALEDFKEIGYSVRKVEWGYQLLKKMPNGPGVGLDIMLFKKEGDKYKYRKVGQRFRHIYFKESDLFPLKLYKMGDLSVWGPQNPIPYLDLAYPRWKTHAYMSNHNYFHGSYVEITDEHLVPGEPFGPLKDNVVKKRISRSDIDVSEVHIEDVPYIVELLKLLEFEALSHEMVAQKLTSFLLSPLDTIFVARLHGLVVGFVALNIINPLYKPKLFARIDTIVVNEKFQRRGIGHILLEAAEEYARLIGCSRIFLTSPLKSSGAHTFYAQENYHDHALYSRYFMKYLDE